LRAVHRRCSPRRRVSGGGVDVQDNRLEFEALALGRNDESWSVDKRVLLGDPSQSAVWDELDRILAESYRTEDGIDLQIQATCIDSGGHHTDAVYKFTEPRFGRRIYAVKGRAGSYPIWPKKAAARKGGIDALHGRSRHRERRDLFGNLKVTEPGPKYCHFGKDGSSKTSSSSPRSKFTFGTTTGTRSGSGKRKTTRETNGSTAACTRWLPGIPVTWPA
jgi:phage terminase large subunit GpA-like protein